jgi:outer membrane protein insertion porin family
VEGQNLITGVGLDMQRTTVDNRFRPTRGTRTELGLERVGLLGGDFDFTRIGAEHQLYLTVNESDLGYKTVLSFKAKTAYLTPEDEAPVFERLYLGGRSFRGFDFRGIGPVGIKQNTGRPGSDQVGGDFMFFAGVEIEQPLWKDVVSVVGFVDSGTVSDDFGFDEYRASVGLGLRLYLPQFGTAPLAFDFGFPILSEDSDEEQLFSFSIDLPF